MPDLPAAPIGDPALKQDRAWPRCQAFNQVFHPGVADLQLNVIAVAREMVGQPCTAGLLDRQHQHVLMRSQLLHQRGKRLTRWFECGQGDDEDRTGARSTIGPHADRAAMQLDLDDARQAFRLSLESGAADDALEIAVGASFLWRQALGCAEGDSWTAVLDEQELSPRDRVWLHILRSDVGQGLGHPRQMFGAGDAPDLSTVDDPSAACLVAHYRALADLTDPQRYHASIAAVRDLAAAFAAVPGSKFPVQGSQYPVPGSPNSALRTRNSELALGWSLKSLHRLIVHSNAYKQSVRFDPRAAAVDGENRLLWRTSPRRLEAEAVRQGIKPWWAQEEVELRRRMAPLDGAA